MPSETFVRRFRRSPLVGWFAMSLLWAGMAACHSKGGRPSATAVGTLPAGCSVVAMLDPSVSKRLEGALDAALATQMANVSILGGLNFRRDVRHVRYCQVDWDASHPGFLLLLAGDISADVLEAVASRAEGHWGRERI